MNNHSPLQSTVRRELSLGDSARPRRNRFLVRTCGLTALFFTLAGGPLAAHSPFEQAIIPGLSSFDVRDGSSPDLVDLDADGDLDLVVGRGFGELAYFENTGTSRAPAFVQRTGSLHPLRSVGDVLRGSPDLEDLDADGDLDLVVGNFDGAVRYFENTGDRNASAFLERKEGANPFDGFAVRGDSHPDLADLDGDGDLDTIVGGSLESTLYLENTGGPSAPAFRNRTGSDNPFNGINIGSVNRPTLADLDGDGDLDAMVGDSHGQMLFYENTGTATRSALVQRTGSGNPLAGFDVGSSSSPDLADLDGDGDLDAVSGAFYGGLVFFVNSGASSSPAFVAPTTPPDLVQGVHVGLDSSPALVDLDGDDDLDAVIGDRDGALFYAENTGSRNAPAFRTVAFADNPFAGIRPGAATIPALADLDGDGDPDAVVGYYSGSFAYLENTGDTTAPAFVERTGAASPTQNLRTFLDSSPDLADLDGDGDFDLVSGNRYGRMAYFENTGSATAPGFVERTGTANVLRAVFSNSFSSPDLVDLDRDGDLDVVLGESRGTLQYFENTGSATTPAFVERSGGESPFADFAFGRFTSPDAADLDDDGDVDVITGENGGRIVLLRSLRICLPDSHTLCLDDTPGDGSFEVRLGFRTAQGSGLSGRGFALDLSSLGVTRGGLFHFGNPANPEMFIKVLNGCPINQRRWVFYSAGTNVGLSVEVRDTATGELKRYTNPDQVAAAPVQDSGALACPGGQDATTVTWISSSRGQDRPAALAVGAPATSSADKGGGCIGSDTALCLQDRFRVEVDFETAQNGGLAGSARVIPLASLGVARGGLFYFFNLTNPEMLIKVIDGCAINGHFWVFHSAVTNLGLSVRITDTVTGQQAEYTNPDLMAALPVQDTGALPCE